MSNAAPVLMERRGSAGLVVLNRPAKLNALNSQLIAELEVALQQLESDDKIGAIVITASEHRQRSTFQACGQSGARAGGRGLRRSS
jgi:enoyl-CoA hydratase/carnithine racemase